jgi:hypothetical protein
MRLRPNVALQKTGRLLIVRAPRALLLIALQLKLGVRLAFPDWHSLPDG